MSPMFQAMMNFAAMGYTVTRSYADGVIRMDKPINDGVTRYDTLYTFIRANGTFSEPESWQGKLARLDEGYIP